MNIKQPTDERSLYTQNGYFPDEENKGIDFKYYKLQFSKKYEINSQYDMVMVKCMKI